MASRPIFIPNYKGEQLVKEVMVDFNWIPGMAVSQKQKNVISLHSAAAEEGLSNILEVSTKSNNSLGIQLSAFRLKLKSDQWGFITIESAFQGSKVFEGGGPYTDLYGKEGRQIKRDERIKKSGKLLNFDFEEDKWKLEPKTAFYDRLYIRALMNNEEKIIDHLEKYRGFTDIEFNPKKSINCQARSCALYVSLKKRNILKDVLNNKKLFTELLEKDSLFQPHSRDKRQGDFLF